MKKLSVLAYIDALLITILTIVYIILTVLRFDVFFIFLGINMFIILIYFIYSLIAKVNISKRATIVFLTFETIFLLSKFLEIIIEFFTSLIMILL